MRLSGGSLHLCGRICAILLAAGGCAAGPVNSTGEYPAKKALIGKTRQDLLTCAGPPISEAASEGQLVFVYYKEASQLEESFPGSKSSFAKVHHGCRATIVFRDDRVSDVHYESDPSSYRDENHCEEIFESCDKP